LGRGGTNVTADVAAVTVRGASVGVGGPVALVVFVAADVACVVLLAGTAAAAVAFVALLAVVVAFVALVARALAVVVAFVALVARAFAVVLAVAVLVTARRGRSDGVVAGTCRRAGAFVAAPGIRLAGARFVRLAGCFCRGSSTDIPVALPMGEGFGETGAVVWCRVSFLAQ